MPINPDIQGFTYDPLSVDYDERDTILYALGVGAGARPDELGLVYEEGLRALPTYPVVGPFPLLMQMEDKLGIDQATVLHGEQRLTLHRPMPARGAMTVDASVSKLWDKGAGAIVDTTAEVRVDGVLVATTTYGSFVRGGGGFGGERGTGLATPEVDGPPDASATEQTINRQAQLYRLSGDTNPLHVDPAFAQTAGFDQPILHGLCTYGFATRMAMHLVADGDPARITGADVRFKSPVFPGETLQVDVWRTGDDTAYARVAVVERDVVVIDPLLLTLAAA